MADTRGERRGAGDRPQPAPRPRRRAPNPIDVAVGSRLRHVRILAGLSQDELGQAIGATGQVIRCYEHGRRRMTPLHLAAASRHLDVPLAFFFNEGPRERPAADPPELSAVERQLIRYYRRIDSEDCRAYLLELTRDMGLMDPLLRDPSPGEPIE